MAKRNQSIKTVAEGLEADVSIPDDSLVVKSDASRKVSMEAVLDADVKQEEIAKVTAFVSGSLAMEMSARDVSGMAWTAAGKRIDVFVPAVLSVEGVSLMDRVAMVAAQYPKVSAADQGKFAELLRSMGVHPISVAMSRGRVDSARLVAAALGCEPFLIDGIVDHNEISINVATLDPSLVIPGGIAYRGVFSVDAASVNDLETSKQNPWMQSPHAALSVLVDGVIDVRRFNLFNDTYAHHARLKTVAFGPSADVRCSSLKVEGNCFLDAKAKISCESFCVDSLLHGDPPKGVAVNEFYSREFAKPLRIGKGVKVDETIEIKTMSSVVFEEGYSTAASVCIDHRAGPWQAAHAPIVEIPSLLTSSLAITAYCGAFLVERTPLRVEIGALRTVRGEADVRISDMAYPGKGGPALTLKGLFDINKDGLLNNIKTDGDVCIDAEWSLGLFHGLGPNCDIDGSLVYNLGVDYGSAPGLVPIPSSVRVTKMLCVPSYVVNGAVISD